MKKVIIIAEAGVNHNADIKMAKDLIDVAAECGADYVKFQTAIPKLVVTNKGELAGYQKENIGEKMSQLEMTKKLHLPLNDFLLLNNYAKAKNIKFLSTPFDSISTDFLSNLNMDFFKIPSGEITNLPYLVKIAKLKKPIILSTGMATIPEIGNALDILISNGISKDKITILHCNTQYPTPFEDVNLRAMLHIQNEFGVDIGYSDHTLGIEVPIAAVALGAKVIEKHFTLDKDLPGPDHKASLQPDELNSMIKAIRNVEKSLNGSGKKIPTPTEEENKTIVRRSIVAKTFIRKGDILTEDNLITKRPGTGITPMMWHDIIGTEAVKDFNEDDLIQL